MLILFALALQAAAPAPAPLPKPADEKKKCRTIPSTGSIMGDRACHTKAEWDAIDRANAANADQYRERRSR